MQKIHLYGRAEQDNVTASLKKKHTKASNNQKKEKWR